MQVGDRFGDRSRITSIVIPRTAITQEGDDETVIPEGGRLSDRDESPPRGRPTTLKNCCVGATLSGAPLVVDP